ncbi:type II toxin-antitoxin system VapC family toxin [Xylella fastidiosa subsp. multiplex]|uniref:Ribonuclease VapC n=1 Tax=Xylella fastidiosa subsp. multiplex TaxID=644357 RepID=A0AAW6HSU3_XYLFS|nr:type II toxin-antitoxin system VapC family toxin [Xylella fastidiosa]MCH7235098.1 type II toxin-antitoxin system VapC family toxin [Xylella fastidiosa subsp. multiplex]MDC6407765.1 type II toxin-antitoxin system VapC family toxin [Xylella fastidiosa subsp. multiplex]MDD0936893.1 type II toxin-antitoxin system VapC family toxin [Xylella fastidiosa subsp. multiplex]MSS67720.1 type II toxin-antitoxin system VapC family toxin [Xylella fastidiosa subsp. multiplex]
MIVLDTNVVSEAMKPEPDAAVRTWLNEQMSVTFYLSSVTLSELLFGIAVLPTSKRKDMLARTLDGLLDLFNERVLPFDTDAARHYAELAVKARNNGRGFPTPDGYIAAIAASRGYIVASRDTSAYESSGVQVINPWQYSKQT